MEDIRALIDLTVKINDAENSGNREWLASILAPRLAFQRADPQSTVDDQVAFLQKVQPGGDRILVKVIEPIQLFGNRAVVQCIIKVGGQDYHNLRFFVRRDGAWKLFAWANETAGGIS